MTLGPIHDPFEVPRELPQDGDLAALMRRLIAHLPERDYCCLAVRSTSPRTVLGAKLSADCVLCGHAVWVAPSSQAVQRRSHFVCDACVKAAAIEAGLVRPSKESER